MARLWPSHLPAPLQDNNAIVREFGSPRSASDGEKLYNHVDLVTLLDIVNLEAGAAVAGALGVSAGG
jgi:seryl-tRNA synthetase